MGLEKILSIAAAGLLLMGCTTTVSFVRARQSPAQTAFNAVKRKAAIAWSMRAGNRLVESCSGRYPKRGLCFVLRDGSSVEYRYGRIAADYISRYIDSMKIDADDKMYQMCLEADKNKDRIIGCYEAKDLYRSSLSRQK